MVGPRDVVISISVLALTGPGLIAAFGCPQLNKIVQDHVDMRHNTFTCARTSCRRPRATTTAVSMVSEREEELKDKIAKLRGAASKGESYERVVGDGKSLTEKMDKSKGEFDATVDRERQVCFELLLLLLCIAVQFRGAVSQRERLALQATGCLVCNADLA